MRKKECNIGKKTKTKCPVHRSTLECKVEEELNTKGINNYYEETELEYTVQAKYIGDFLIHEPYESREGVVILECKSYDKYGGLHLYPVRKKMLAVKKCNPTVDIRFVFDKKNLKVSPTMTYEQWCDKHHFKYYYLGELKPEDLK